MPEHKVALLTAGGIAPCLSASVGLLPRSVRRDLWLPSVPVVDPLVVRPATATVDRRVTVSVVLNWAPVALVGTWSYSIYLWQELFLAHQLDGFRLRFPMNLIAALTASLLSYYLVEVNFRSLGRKTVHRVPESPPHRTVGIPV